MAETPLVDNNDITLFARTNYRNMMRPFGIKTDDRRRHMYVIGKTGMGKSTLLENMVIQDIRAGRGLAVVDPHGDLVEKVIRFIPSYRINDVVYFNPSDVDYPIAFNILESVDPTHRHLVASGLIGVFKKLWAESWGPRLEYILRNTILALIEYPGSTLLGVTRMFVDKEYQRKVVNKINDPIVKAFWRDEFASFNDKFRTEAVSPIQNKIGQFLSSSIIRNIVGQPKSTIDMRAIMDDGKILLMNLAKGRIGEDNAALLGAMMITKLQLAAMSRIDIPETERRDFYLYVDEFQNFATESFAGILSEARKYRLDLIIAHQYIEQLDEKVRAAVFGNVGTMVTFRVGAADAEFLAKEYEPIFTEVDLVNLTKYDVYLKLMIDGVASEPFSATGLPPVSTPDNLEQRIITVSRERYTKTRESVEDKISRWTGMAETMQATAAEENRSFERHNRPSGEGSGPDRKKDQDFTVLDRQPVVVNHIPEPISLTQALQQTTPHAPSHPTAPARPDRSPMEQSPATRGATRHEQRVQPDQRPRRNQPPRRNDGRRDDRGPRPRAAQPRTEARPEPASMSLGDLKPRPAMPSQGPVSPPAPAANPKPPESPPPTNRPNPPQPPPPPPMPPPVRPMPVPPSPSATPHHIQPGEVVKIS